MKTLKFAFFLYLVIVLPEETSAASQDDFKADVEKALATLSKMDKETGLFSRDITAIDMRLPDRLTVRLSEDAAKARNDLLKDKKPKKAGNA